MGAKVQKNKKNTKGKPILFPHLGLLCTRGHEIRGRRLQRIYRELGHTEQDSGGRNCVYIIGNSFTLYYDMPCTLPPRATPNRSTLPVLIAISTRTYRHKSLYLLPNRHVLSPTRTRLIHSVSTPFLTIIRANHTLSSYRFMRRKS